MMFPTQPWIIWAMLSAVFAALTAIFAKIGIRGVDADLATLIRTGIISVVLSAFVAVTGKWSNPLQLPAKTWLFLILSGLATGASWVCYFRALQLGEASKVAPIDKFSLVLVAIIFFLNGLGIISQVDAARELTEHGAPATLVPVLMLRARSLEVVAGFGLAFGIHPRLAAPGVAFLVPTTFVAHSLGKAAGRAAFTPQLLNFLKNTAMVGGLLFIAATKSQPTLLPRTSRSNDQG